MADSRIHHLPESKHGVDREPLRDSPDANTSRVPSIVFVDLDGSLIATDVLIESILTLLKMRPLAAVQAIWSGRRGRAEMKQAIAEHVVPDPRRLPYRDEVLEHLHELRSAGASVVLATATTAKVANQVSMHLGIFDAVLASDETRNLKGPTKLEAIRAYCAEHGHDAFAYIGDSVADLPIWEQAAQVYLVAPSSGLRTAVERFRRPTKVFAGEMSPWKAWFKALRPQQWIKNLLLFGPLLLAHEWADLGRLSAVLWAVVAFCCAASATYLVNDVLDVEADRSHPRKRRRPFASGAISLAWGPMASFGLFAIASGIALWLPHPFAWLLVTYIVTTLLYSTWLKRKLLFDVFVLAGLYTIRLLAGGAAAGVPVSEWLLAMSMFLFLSLAFGKRYTELLHATDDELMRQRGRGYQRSDATMLGAIGPCCGFLAVLVMALYIHGDVAARLYPNRWALWLICPLAGYWISRFWVLASRGGLLDDPLVFAIKDRISLIVCGLVAVLAILATIPWPK